MVALPRLFIQFHDGGGPYLHGEKDKGTKCPGDVSKKAIIRVMHRGRIEDRVQSSLFLRWPISWLRPAHVIETERAVMKTQLPGEKTGLQTTPVWD